jgi:hypothetical protein
MSGHDHFQAHSDFQSHYNEVGFKETTTATSTSNMWADCVEKLGLEVASIN